TGTRTEQGQDHLWHTPDLTLYPRDGDRLVLVVVLSIHMVKSDDARLGLSGHFVGVVQEDFQATERILCVVLSTVPDVGDVIHNGKSRILSVQLIEGLH